MTPPDTLITGASGFIGGHLAHALTGTRNVRLLLRDIGDPSLPGERVIVPDWRDEQKLAAAVAGVDVVVHAAGRAHVMREDAQQGLVLHREMNRDMTLALAKTAAAAGVRHFVFLSTVAVAGGEREEAINESTRSTPATPYGIAKLEAEEGLQQIAEQTGMAVTVLRPAMVYGPGMKGNPQRLFDAVHRGLPMPLASVRNRRSLLYIENLTAAVSTVVDHPPTRFATYYVADAEAVSTPQLIRLIARELNRPARLFPLPQALLRPFAIVGDVLARVVPFPLTSATLARLFGSLELDTSALARATGYRQPHSLEQGVRKTAHWYLEQKTVK